MKIYPSPRLTAQELINRCYCADEIELVVTDDYGHDWARYTWPRMTRSMMSTAQDTASWRALLGEPATMHTNCYGRKVITVHAQQGTMLSALRSALLRRDWREVDALYARLKG